MQMESESEGEHDSGQPRAQYLSADRVLAELGDHGAQRVFRLTAAQILVLGALAGGFIMMGAVFSLIRHRRLRFFASISLLQA